MQIIIKSNRHKGGQRAAWIGISLSLLQLQTLSSIHWNIRPYGKDCLSLFMLMERLCHRSGKWRQLMMTLRWTKPDGQRERIAVWVYERVQLGDKTLCFPCQSMPLLNKHSSGSDVHWQRGAIVVVSAWQRDSSQNTAMTARRDKEGGEW